MGNENGVWIIRGVDASDPNCIHSADQLISFVNTVGFLPLFRNEIPGFSVEEYTDPRWWWSGDSDRDPWEWRESIAKSGQLAYGKFFDKKAGFISPEWLPYFANHRRSGYDFDALWDDGKASYRQKRIMDLFDSSDEMFSYTLKEEAGFGQDGEKNFDGVLTALQMSTYLCVRDFRKRINKKGQAYGWSIAVYAKPETLWGYEHLSSAYGESPQCSRERIISHIQHLYPKAPEKFLKKI